MKTDNYLGQLTELLVWTDSRLAQKSLK